MDIPLMFYEWFDLCGPISEKKGDVDVKHDVPVCSWMVMVLSLIH
jgi:hypothetical protein